MSAVVWCDLSATVCGAEYNNGMPAARVREEMRSMWSWHAWDRFGNLLPLGSGFAKVGEAMAAAERQIDAAQAVLSPDGATLTGPAEAATAREALEDAALAGAYERPRPRTSGEVKHAAPLPHGPPCPGFARHAGIGMICLHCGLSPAEHAPLPEPAAERLPTPEESMDGWRLPADEEDVIGYIQRDRDAILARLDPAIRLESWVLVHALRAELRGGAT